MREAEVVTTEHGKVPRGEGWYVLNAEEAVWQHMPGHGGSDCNFQGDVRFEQLGVHVGVLQPGEPACMYHREDNQEGFLILKGECLLIVEGEERTLRAWDYFHCPPGTEHVLVGAGSEPCVAVSFGSRATRGAMYVADAAAARHGASVEKDTTSSEEAYAGTPDPVDGPAPRLPRP
jgi:uncharacterized cupin superfamily protein